MQIGEYFLQFSSDPTTLLFIIVGTLLLLGMFIDALPLLVLVVPIFVPVIIQLGIDPVFFGIVTILTLMIGILTPPMGTALFMVSRVGDIPAHVVIKGIIPFLVPAMLHLGVESNIVPVFCNYWL